MREHSYLTVVSASKIKSIKHGSEKAPYKEMVCIVLYVDFKGAIPIHEALFQTDLDGIHVDVREGTFTTYGKFPPTVDNGLSNRNRLLNMCNSWGICANGKQ